MSYKVLARKWRPQHFRDMLGQEPVLRALVNALDTNRLHHAYLFTGMRGVGKTTIARIFAKCLNCETNGVSSDPCGTCSACQDIDAGRFFDLIEVDAASRTKVESTRELLENVPYAPASGRYKVYLIDEVHMFSTHSFNALLKTLEEPPEHVKFLLATTDPQKVPATVLSRCLQFNLKRMSPGILTEYLSKILKEEAIEHELAALDLIARASEGSVRDALSLVEQAAASGEGSIRARDVESMLGRASIERLLSLIETLAAGDMPALFAQVEELAQYAPEFAELLGELITLLHRIAMLRMVPGSVAETEPGYDRLSALAAGMDPDVVQLFYQIGLHARRDMPYAPDTREAFDMALLRMHAFKPQQGGGGAGSIAPNGQPPAASLSAGLEQTSRTSTQAATPAQKLRKGAEASSPLADGRDGAASSDSPSGLAVRGSVSAGGSMRAAALAAARGEPLPDDVVEQLAQLNGQIATPTPKASAQGKPSTETGLQTSAGTPAPESDSTREKPERSAGTHHSQSPAAPAAPAAPASPASPSAQAQVATHPQQPASVERPTSTIDSTAITAADWPQLIRELGIAGMPMQLANNCTWAGLQNDQIKLLIEESSEHLHKEAFVARLQSALGKWFGRDIRISIERVAQTLETPAKLAEKQAATDMAAAHDSIKLDPIVQQLIDQVDGAVDEASIRPIER